MAKCGWCVNGRYQGFNDPAPKPCDKCGGTGTVNVALPLSGGLIHGMYHVLDEKLETVRNYPGVTGAMLDAAIKEATDSGRIDRFEAESPGNKGLDIVVSVYLDDAPDTLVYVRNRMKDAFGDRFLQWDELSGPGIDRDRVRYLQDAHGNILVPVHRDCVRIEVVDLFANWNPDRGMVPCGVRNASSAHFAALFAAAQDPDWVRAMSNEEAGHVFVGGLELNVPGYGDLGEWSHVLNVGSRYDGAARLDGDCYSHRYHYAALPSLRE